MASVGELQGPNDCWPRKTQILDSPLPGTMSQLDRSEMGHILTLPSVCVSFSSQGEPVNCFSSHRLGNNVSLNVHDTLLPGGSFGSNSKISHIHIFEQKDYGLFSVVLLFHNKSTNHLYWGTRSSKVWPNQEVPSLSLSEKTEADTLYKWNDPRRNLIASSLSLLSISTEWAYAASNNNWLLLKLLSTINKTLNHLSGPFFGGPVVTHQAFRWTERWRQSLGFNRCLIWPAGLSCICLCNQQLLIVSSEGCKTRQGIRCRNKAVNFSQVQEWQLCSPRTWDWLASLFYSEFDFVWFGTMCRFFQGSWPPSACAQILYEPVI